MRPAVISRRVFRFAQTRGRRRAPLVCPEFPRSVSEVSLAASTRDRHFTADFADDADEFLVKACLYLRCPLSAAKISSDENAPPMGSARVSDAGVARRPAVA